MIRPTFAYFLFPTWFLDTDFNWDDFDIEKWSWNEYEWIQDDWNGLKDTVKEPAVVLDEYGDCDDYSVVALSYLYTTTDHNLRLVALYSTSPFVGHMVTYDETTETVYSSGEIIDMSLEEYKKDSPYTIHITRTVQ